MDRKMLYDYYDLPFPTRFKILLEVGLVATGEAEPEGTELGVKLRKASPKKRQKFAELIKKETELMDPLFDANGRYMIHRRPVEFEGIKLTVASLCSAFDQSTIGSKFRTPAVYRDVCKAIAAHTFPENGQAKINVPDLIPVVRSGDALKPEEPHIGQYVLREYRGNINKYLRSNLAEKVPVVSCHLIVYTKAAYLTDPDVQGDPEANILPDIPELERIEAMDCTHVLVAVLATGSTVEGTVSPYRFIANLAGGNIDYDDLTKPELVDLARKVKTNSDNAWMQVADLPNV